MSKMEDKMAARLNKVEKKALSPVEAMNAEIEPVQEKPTLDFMEKKPKLEDTHTRVTFMLDNEMLKELNKYAKNNHGFKTQFFNYVVRKGLDDIKSQS